MYEKFVLSSARKILNDYNLYDLPINLNRLIRKMNIDLQYIEDFPEPDITSTLLIYGTDKPENFKVLINNFCNNTKKRFIIAHNIAHIILHSLQMYNSVHIDTSMLIFYDKNRAKQFYIDLEANKFAFELLMPSDLVETYFNNHILDKAETIIEFLSEIFDVNITFMAKKLVTLNLLKKF